MRFSVFYLAGGLVAMLAQVVASPGSTVPNLGASGAIAAVMGAFLVTYPRDRMRSLLVIFICVRATFIPAALLIVVWFLIQLINAGSVANVQTIGVAYLAHWRLHFRACDCEMVRGSPTGCRTKVEPMSFLATIRFTKPAKKEPPLSPWHARVSEHTLPIEPERSRYRLGVSAIGKRLSAQTRVVDK
jgi:hypothetical protein